ncbi:MAG: glycosyltransferase family 2 protein [Patescibacteria group bacterium]
MKIKLSIIIVNWNTKDLVINLVKSIKELPFLYEIILIDNSSDFKPYDIENPYLRLINNSENLYFAKACNQGVMKARGEYIMLLGSDTEIIDNAIETLVEFLDKNKDYEIVAPQLINKDLSIQKSCRKFPSLYNILFNDYKLKNWDHRDSRDVDQPQATCILVRRNVIARYGLFDERFPLYFNDVDFFKKMQKNNIKTYYLSTAKVIHLYGASTKKLGIKGSRSKRKFLLYKGYIQYLLKWGIF